MRSPCRRCGSCKKSTVWISDVNLAQRSLASTDETVKIAGPKGPSRSQNTLGYYCFVVAEEFPGQFYLAASNSPSPLAIFGALDDERDRTSGTSHEQSRRS